MWKKRKRKKNRSSFVDFEGCLAVSGWLERVKLEWRGTRKGRKGRGRKRKKKEKEGKKRREKRKEKYLNSNPETCDFGNKWEQEGKGKKGRKRKREKRKREEKKKGKKKKEGRRFLKRGAPKRGGGRFAPDVERKSMLKISSSPLKKRIIEKWGVGPFRISNF